MYYTLPPGKRIGWHSNDAEEIQFVYRGSAELLLDDRVLPIKSGDLFPLMAGQEHDIRNTGRQDLCVIAFFPEPQVAHHWRDDAWIPDDRRVTVTKNG